MKRMIIEMLFEFFLQALDEAAERTTNTIDDEFIQVLAKNADEIYEILEEKF